MKASSEIPFLGTCTPEKARLAWWTLRRNDRRGLIGVLVGLLLILLPFIADPPIQGLNGASILGCGLVNVYIFLILPEVRTGKDWKRLKRQIQVSGCLSESGFEIDRKGSESRSFWSDFRNGRDRLADTFRGSRRSTLLSAEVIFRHGIGLEAGREANWPNAAYPLYLTNAMKLDRRGFLRAGAFGLLGCSGGRASFFQVGTRAAASDFEFDELTISQLQQRMEAGRLTARALTQANLDRIERVDRQGPTLHSVIEINPDAVAIAEARDKERQTRGTRGPLHGIPLLLKDNINAADRNTTTAGSLALAGSVAPRDAFLVQRLRTAGAVLLGKANLSEWSRSRSINQSAGWSARGGQCKNPYALDRSPGGSSSGCGAAVAANLCAAAVGTETDGSIVNPSCVNGIVGLKPALGLRGRTAPNNNGMQRTRFRAGF
jgi:hypothetical protein